MSKRDISKLGEDDDCPGCEHFIAGHFVNVKGVVRCAYVEHGTSSSGIIGIPYTRTCDCRNYVSNVVQRERDRQAAHDKKWREAIAERLKP